MPRLSYIVPVYNVAPYLRKCVDSLLVQDYKNYEIILVDDGSTDGCGAICDEYAAYENIRVIHQPNAGLSAARNAGLTVAKGKYICFVDSDDYWEEDVLGGLMEQLEREKLDVLRFDYQNVRIKDEGVNEFGNRERYEVFQPYKSPHQTDTRHDVVNGKTYLDERMGYACYAWQFLINRELTDTFTPGIHFEDVDWLPRMMLQAKRVSCTQRIVYNYLVRQGSITQAQGDMTKIRKNLEDRMTIIEKYNSYMVQHPECVWLKNMQSNMVAGVLATVAQTFYSERRQYISRLRALNVFPLSIADQGHTYERKARLINISPRLLVLILYLKSIIS